MKQIFLNLKRFDVPVEEGGINRLAEPGNWGSAVVSGIQDGISGYKEEAEFAAFFPEAYLLDAVRARKEGSNLQIGCQGVYREDVEKGGNFGAFTTLFPAASAKALGAEYTIIGHCEERKDKMAFLSGAGMTGEEAKNAVGLALHQEILCALHRGLKVLYCIGEKSEEQDRWKEVLGAQLETGLAGIGEEEKKRVVLAYEPVWSIGPGKTPADASYITKVARFVKGKTDGLPLVYGGGLKKENAQMLAAIPEIDGGLIALTRFSGEIGFYPDEYLEIVHLYLNGCAHS